MILLNCITVSCLHIKLEMPTLLAYTVYYTVHFLWDGDHHYRSPILAEEWALSSNHPKSNFLSSDICGLRFCINIWFLKSYSGICEKMYKCKIDDKDVELLGGSSTCNVNTWDWIFQTGRQPSHNFFFLFAEIEISFCFPGLILGFHYWA